MNNDWSMKMNNETKDPFSFFSCNESDIRKHLMSGKAACMVLAKELTPQQFSKAVDYGYVFVNPYNGEDRYVAAFGCYRNQIKRMDLPDPEVMRKCAKARILQDGIYPIKAIVGYTIDPLSIVLNNSLDDQQFKALTTPYETIEVDYKGEKYTVVACTYYDPYYEMEGKILSQHMYEGAR